MVIRYYLPACACSHLSACLRATHRQAEYEAWKGEDLSCYEVVYQWADGIYVKAGLERDKAALLVVVAALTNGEKKILVCESGYRESAESWSSVLRNLTCRRVACRATAQAWRASRKESSS